MLDYVYGQDEVIAQFVASLIPAVREQGFGACKAIGVIDEDYRLIAGMVYHNWNKKAEVIEMSGAALPGKQWLTRETIRRLWAYPFLDIGCQMVMMMVPSDNTRLLRQLEALNYAFIPIPRLLGRDRDAMVCRLTREEWEEGKFCQRFKHHLTHQLSEAA